jgi:hypothetical protein
MPHLPPPPARPTPPEPQEPLVPQTPYPSFTLVTGSYAKMARQGIMEAAVD